MLDWFGRRIQGGFLRIQRLRLDSGYTRLRPSTEFMLNFTYFYVQVSSRSIPVLLSSVNGVRAQSMLQLPARGGSTWKADITSRPCIWQPLVQ